MHDKSCNFADRGAYPQWYIIRNISQSMQSPASEKAIKAKRRLRRNNIQTHPCALQAIANRKPTKFWSNEFLLILPVFATTGFCQPV